MKNHVRPRGAVHRTAVIVPAVILAALLFAIGGGRTEQLSSTGMASHEPASRMQMGPRVLSRTDHGDHFRVLVEVTLSTSIHLPPAHVTARRPDGFVLAAQDLHGAIPPRGQRKVVLDLTLKKGHEHHIFFDLVANSGEPRLSGSAPVWSPAYLRVNLDPDKEPRDAGDVLEYRAIGQGGSR